ncbi:hypothetical protein JVT61DRAFT_11920 [Boletus reticuloceps]|uniref:F-box domain-containing protein n=1 Tax=Boletus reticuloceps TaxID=495285 RepID=A0A8I2YUD4_9AGAM|nr:hypothetical protein JVT61DRAFT_11920 [Boletus reticuloceps]
MHRCLLISEILCNILEFTQQYEESPSDDGCKEGRKLRNQTLVYLAQTCHTFSSPALDQLWIRLDSLGPLIKLLPENIWKNPFLTLVRVFWIREHASESRFHQYAARVRSLHGPGHDRDITPWVQRSVVTALAQTCQISLPLLPNLTELVWDELPVAFELNMTISLVKFLAGPRLTNLSLLLQYMPTTSARHVLYNLPYHCQNVTSFTIIFRGNYPKLDAIAQYTTDVVGKWPRLQVLKSSPLFPYVAEVLASKPSVHTLNLEVDQHSAVCKVGKLPDSIDTLILVAHNIRSCLKCLPTIQGSLVRFHLHIYPWLLHPSDMGAIFQTLPAQFDITQLRFLTIELTFEDYHLGVARKHLPSLREPFLASLNSFSALHTLDLSSFCTSDLDDAVYARMAATWPELRCLKMGTADISNGKPVASVGAVIAVLRFCPRLQTLHIVFDGSIPPPCPTMNDEESGVSVERVEEGKEEQEMVGQVNRWGVSNAHITQIHIGHSPTGWGMDTLEDLATCLRSVMPQLGTIQSKKEPSAVAERWQMVQRMLVGGDLEVGT